MRQLSRRYVEAKSNRLGDVTRDQPALSAGGKGPARHPRRFANGPADFRGRRVAEFVREETLPGLNVQTSMIGSRAFAVVDDELRVESLRVIDASVMPAVTLTNTNAPTVMIAEKGAAVIKDTALQRRAA